MKRIILFFGVFLLLLLNGCSWDDGNHDDGNHAEPPTTVYPQIDDCPCFSPDGNSIAYHHYHMKYILSSGSYNYDRDSTGIWFVDADGSNPRMFLKGGDLPDWSPDGEWIAFVGPAKNIWKIKSNGDSLTQLTSGRRTFFPDWSPDGAKIAYDQSIATAGHPSGIWIMNADGTNDHNLGLGRNPDWSPDGFNLIYQGPPDSTESESQIWVADTSGTNPNQLSKQGMSNRGPTWSPDGNYLAYISYRDDTPNLFVIDIYGENIKQLTFAEGKDTVLWPSWSPVSDLIAYSFNKAGHEIGARLYTIKADGTEMTEILSPDDPTRHDSEPDWSPDGNIIYFLSNRSRQVEIWKIDYYKIVHNMTAADETKYDDIGLEQIANLFSSGVAPHHRPRVSPDGKKIVFYGGGQFWFWGYCFCTWTNAKRSQGNKGY